MKKNSFPWMITTIILVIIIIVGGSLVLTKMPGSTPASTESSAGYEGMVSSQQLLRVPVSGIYPGATTVGLNPDMKNPLANDPDAIIRGAEDFDKFNCSGCHMAHGGGGMGPALSDNKWLYRKSAANIYLDIAQGRSAGMPAWGGVLPDRTIWELVAYVQSISNKPSTTFGTTTSATPQSPKTEQVPAEDLNSATPWEFTEPMPPNGERPGSKAAEKDEQ